MPNPLNLPGPGPFLPFHENPETPAVAAEEAIEVHASQPHYGEFQDFEWNEESYWTTVTHESSLDAIPAIIAGPEPVQLQSAQWDNEGYQFESLEDGWHQAVYGFPDQALDVAATLFPPVVTTDFLATQLDPSVGQDDYYTEPQTEDYANDSTIDTSWSMDFASGAEVTIATQPLPEFPEFPDDLSQFDTSYVEQNEGTQFPPPTIGDELFAAQLDPSIGQDPGLNPEWDYTEDQPLVDGAVEAFQSPNDAFDVTIATQPLAEQPWFPDQDIDTELQNDPTLDTTAATSFPPAVTEPFFAQYPLAEQLWFPDQETEEYAYEPTLDLTPFFFPSAAVAPPDTATQLDPSVGQDWLLWPDADPTNDQPLVDGAPEIIGTNAQFQPDEPLWNKLNRAHQNPGHWDDVSQGRILRWPP